MNYLRFNQNKLRTELYSHLKDAVDKASATNDQVMADNIGQAFILPSSFTSGPRYMHEKTQDALAYVRKYGTPDLFITMTCNQSSFEVLTAFLFWYLTFLPGDNFMCSFLILESTPTLSMD